MILKGGSSRTPIGLEVGARRIKAVQLRPARDGWHIAAISSLPRKNRGPDVDPEELPQLRRVLDRQGFSGRDVVLAVPRAKLMTGILDVPPQNSGAPLEQIVRVELARMHNIQPDSFELSYWHLPACGRAKGASEAMAVCCPHDEAHRLLDTFEAEGFNVKALDAGTCAAARACRTAMACGGDGITAILDLGWSAACLSMMRQGLVIYERILNGGGLRHLAQSMGSLFQMETEMVDRLLVEVGLDRAVEGQSPGGGEFDEIGKVIAAHLDAIVRELRAPFCYATHRYPGSEVNRMLLIGGGAGIPGLVQYLCSAVQTEVTKVAPADLAQCPQSLLVKSGDAAMTLAMGLAQYDRRMAA